MHKVYFTTVFLFCLTNIYGQAGLWTWVNGDTTLEAPPVFGTQGNPNAANHPAGSYEGCEWTDKQGNFWFFETGFSQGYDNDLWKYDPVNNMWTWIKGNGIMNDTGSYGILGVSFATNLPPCRGYGMASWTDTSGVFWMYGGFNSISNGGQDNTFNDLWKYDLNTNEWTWVQGSKTPNQSPVYGTKGISSPLNTPGARSEAVCTWVDNNNNLWLFGGAGISDGQYNDLWKYNISTNEWTWMNGADTLDSPGYYGIQGQASPLNVPSARYAYSRWKDKAGNFWMFGGWNRHAGCPGLGSYHNDMWKYEVSNNQWIWIKGPDFVCDTGSRSPVCLESINNNPISRMESRSCWVDNSGDFWMFGGEAFDIEITPYAMWLNDVWRYTIANNEWKLMWTDSIPNQLGNAGIKGVTSPCNRPLGRMGSVSWYKPNTNSMYLFGGYQSELPGSARCRSEMWKYEIDTTCAIQSCSITGMNETQNTIGLLFYPNPTSSTLTVSFESTSEQKIELLIYNILGEQVYLFATSSQTGVFSKEINLQTMSNGIYFLQLQTKSVTINRRILKQ